MGLFSNILSAFQPKKTPAQQPVQSVAQQKVASSTPNLFSVGAAPKPAVSSQPTPNYSAAPKTSVVPSYSAPKPQPQPAKPSPAVQQFNANPVNQFAQQVAKGQGISAVQKMVAPPTLPQRPQTQVQKVQTVANRPAPMQGPQQNPNPVVQNQQTQAAAPTQSPAQMNMLDWFNKSGSIADDSARGQIDNSTNATNEYIKMLNESYGKQKEELLAQIPYLKNVSDQTRAELLAAADDIRKSGDLEKQQAGATYDEATLSSARTKKEVDAQRQNTFAALGTIDSNGSMGFTGQQMKSDEEFNRVQQNRETEKARVITAIDAKVKTAERTAQNEIAKEANSFQETVRKIQSAANMTDMQKEQETRAAYTDLKATVQGINDNLAVNKQNSELQKLQYMQEFEKMNLPDPSKTGEAEAKLRGEYFDRTKNSKYDDAINNYQKIITAADNAAGDMSLIFQYMKLLDPGSTVREGEFANAQQATGVSGNILNLYNQALSGRRLNPQQRQDFTSSALDAVKPIIAQQRSNESFYSNLASQAGANPGAVVGGQRILVRYKASGQIGMLDDVSEFNDQQYERI